MPPIAPWEDPNLPAPIAVIERVIEGRTRRFALWFWDGRLVWRDLDYPKLWWASLDLVDGDAVEVWERVVATERFGRALTYKPYMLDSSLLFSLSVYGFSKFPRIALHVIVSDTDCGLWRAKDSETWRLFYIDEKSRVNSQAANFDSKIFSIWNPECVFPDVIKLLSQDLALTLTTGISPALRKFLELGNSAPFFLLLCDLTAWIIVKNSEARGQKLNQQFEEQFRLFPRLSAYFSLPKESTFTLYDPIFEPPRVGYNIEVAGISWEIDKGIPVSLSTHEVLELQLRLRDALRPILTPTEIEEILAPPERP